MKLPAAPPTYRRDDQDQLRHALELGLDDTLSKSAPQLTTNLTAAGTPVLTANCPAVTPGAIYTWARIFTADGSIGWIPVWK